MSLEKTVIMPLNGFDTYFLDVDSTLTHGESIELLVALYRPNQPRLEATIKEFTNNAMGLPEGERHAFFQIYQRRLDLIQPKRKEVEGLAAHVAENDITEEAQYVVPELIQRGKQVILVSGGIDNVVGAVARKLGVTAWFGVPLIFDELGRYAGFYWTPTVTENGKGVVASLINYAQRGKASILVGDGMTDAMAKGHVDCFAAYTGICSNRPAVVGMADVTIASLRELLLPDKTVKVCQIKPGEECQKPSLHLE